MRIEFRQELGGGCGTSQLLNVYSHAAPIHYLPLLQISSRFRLPIFQFGLLSHDAMFGFIPPPTSEDTSLRMMKQDTVNQPGAKASRGVSQQFEFINLLNRPGLTDVGTKKAVRAHAMRDFRRRRGESYDNGRRKETSNIKTADPSKPSPTVQPSPNGVALDPPVWALSMGTAEDSLPLIDATYAEEDLHFFMPHERDDDDYKSAFGFNSDTASHGSILTDGGDELGAIMSLERPRKRKKLHDYDEASPVTFGEDGENGDGPPKSLGYHVADEMMVVSPRLIKTPGAGSPDPFNALPIACTQRVRILMHHCKLIKPLKVKSFVVLASSSHPILVSSRKICFGYGNSCIL